MSKYGYRNIWYDPRKKQVHLWTWDEHGNRIEHIEAFSPYLYIESNSKSDATSIFNTPLRKISFPSQFDRRKYVNESGLKRLFYNLKAEQQYLLDNCLMLNEQPEFNKNPLKIFSLDIETYSPSEFPDIQKANHPINLITIHDSLNDTYYTFGTKPYTTTEANVKYIYCATEVEMLTRFIRFWEREPPDIVTGWNSEFFDIPYIINRITNLLGMEYTNKLSPVESLFYKEDIKQQYGKTQGKWVINGLSCIDYKEVYETFSRSELESYKLDYVAKVELNEGKTDVNTTNLAKLSDQDWNKFVEYNIQDVRLLVKLEDKLRFLKIMRTIAYKGFTNIEATMGKVMVVTGTIAAQSLKHNKIIPTFVNDHVGDYAGGFVKEIQPSLSTGVVTFDANSLYPNTLITLNLSQETKIGKIINVEADKDLIELKLINGKVHTLTSAKFKDFIASEKIAISKAKVLFSQKQKGIIPEYVDSLYRERVAIKEKMNSVERSLAHCKPGSDKWKENKTIIEQLDLQQYTIKILLNSIYGVFANKYSPFADVDLASSITLTGQAVIKEASDIVDNYAKEKYGVTESVVIYNDTDSTHVTIQPILNKLGYNLHNSKNEISSETYDITTDLNKVLNEEINKWARQSLHSSDPRFFFKREAICAAGIYQSKKHYILHIKDKGEDKPLPCDKIKYVGVEVAKSTMSDNVKTLIKDVVKAMLYTKDEQQSTAKYREAYEKFKALPPEEIAFRSNINKYELYASKAQGYAAAKRTPVHVKAALYYNKLIDELGVKSNYEQITSGNKMKWLYCVPQNKYNIEEIAFTAKIPKEFDFLVPDYDKMFDKIVRPAIQRLYECTKWNLVDIRNEYSCNLLDLFKE